MNFIDQFLSPDAQFTLGIFGQVFAWFLTIFATLLLVTAWGFPHTWSLLNVMWDHYIMKRDPEITIVRGLQSKWNVVREDRGPVHYLKERIRLLEKDGERKFERKVLQDIVDNMGEIRIKRKGKYNHKLRGKGHTVTKGKKQKVKL